MIITWHDSGREPQCRPDPAYPNGRDLPAPRGSAATCKTDLPYPAKRCGHIIVRCETCGYSIAITTAGRPDDPRSVELPCQSARATKQ